eukprot:scaffold151456_cov23-Prasinocladus_malaysianus.AAC.1
MRTFLFEEHIIITTWLQVTTTWQLEAVLPCHETGPRRCTRCERRGGASQTWEELGGRPGGGCGGADEDAELPVSVLQQQGVGQGGQQVLRVSTAVVAQVHPAVLVAEQLGAARLARGPEPVAWSHTILLKMGGQPYHINSCRFNNWANCALRAETKSISHNINLSG